MHRSTGACTFDVSPDPLSLTVSAVRPIGQSGSNASQLTSEPDIAGQVRPPTTVHTRLRSFSTFQRSRRHSRSHRSSVPSDQNTAATTGVRDSTGLPWQYWRSSPIWRSNILAASPSAARTTACNQPRRTNPNLPEIVQNLAEIRSLHVNALRAWSMLKKNKASAHTSRTGDVDRRRRRSPRSRCRGRYGRRSRQPHVVTRCPPLACGDRADQGGPDGSSTDDGAKVQPGACSESSRTSAMGPRSLPTSR